MLEQDYLMRILLQFAEAIRRSWSRAVEDRDPRDAANMLERAVGDATPAYTGALAAATDGFDVVAPRGADPAEDEADLATLLSAARER